MTIDLETNLETSSTDDETESLDASLLASIQDLSGDDGTTETDQAIVGSESEEKPKSSAEQASEAARILASARKRTPKIGADGKPVEAAPVERQPLQAVKKLEPPYRWPVDKKEWFLKQPAEAQEEMAKGWQQMEAHFTKGTQELNRQKQRYAELERVVTPYVQKWNIKGMTDVQVMAELCATQDLFSKDAVEACELVLQKSGVTPEQLIARRGGAQATPQQHAPVPQQNNILTAEDVSRIVNQTLQGANTQQAQSAAVVEVQGVRNEIGADGKYSYPELWSDDYLERVKPLVADLRKTQPNISWADATRKAVSTLRYHDGYGSPSPATPRVTSQEDINRVKGASVSIRGRGNVSIPTQTQAKNGESLSESIEATIAALTTH